MLCNNSSVDYPKVGVVLVLTRCSCSTSHWAPQRHRRTLRSGHRQLDKAAASGHRHGHGLPRRLHDVQELPKGKAVTLQSRIALDAWMTEGKGGVEATAVMPDPLVQIGKADLPFTVVVGFNDSPAGVPANSVAVHGPQRPEQVAVDGPAACTSSTTAASAMS